MPNQPIPYFVFTLLFTFIFWFAAALFSHQKGREKLLMPLLLLGLLGPCLVALSMLYHQGLLQDFWQRLFLYKIEPGPLLLIFLVMPATFFLATALSLLFGKSAK